MCGLANLSALNERAQQYGVRLAARDARERKLQQQVTPTRTLGATSEPLSGALSLAELVAVGRVPEDTMAD